MQSKVSRGSKVEVCCKEKKLCKGDSGSGEKRSRATDLLNTCIVEVTNSVLLSECMPVGNTREIAVFKYCINMHGALVPRYTPSAALLGRAEAYKKQHQSRSAGLEPSRKHCKGAGTPDTATGAGTGECGQLCFAFVLCKLTELEADESAWWSLLQVCTTCAQRLQSL